MSFAESLANGQLGESIIAKWVRSRGNCVLPVYEKEINSGKGPRFFAPKDKQFVAPDMFVMPSMIWIEAKHKTVFTWHRISNRWCTGIDLHHYREYLHVEEISGRPVWLFFLHRIDRPDKRDLQAGCTPKCPVGLFGNRLSFLKDNENHRHHNHGKSGMVYWAEDFLDTHATLDELAEIS